MGTRAWPTAAGENASIARPRSRRQPRRPRIARAKLLLLAAAVAAGAAAAFLLVGSDSTAPPSVVGPHVVGPDPLAFAASRTTAYEQAAAFGLSHVLFTKSPGGAVATARRTARFRPLIEDAVAGSGLDADLIEAVFFLESAGRPEVIAGDDPSAAVGLGQILAETAQNFLGMHVELATSRRLTRRIEAAERRGDAGTARRLRAERRRVDARFDPPQAIAGTIRYLEIARRRYGRDDLAVASYHMGIGNLDAVLRAYAGSADAPVRTIVDEGDLSWARVYFDSSPTRHRDAWLRLIALGDDSQTYYWRVLAARAIMRLSRRDPEALARLAGLHGRHASAERVLHPPQSTDSLADADALATAWSRRELRPLPDEPDRLHARPSLLLGAQAAGGVRRSLYRGLRPEALRLLVYLARWVHDLSGAEAPLTVAEAVYDRDYGNRLPAGRSEPAAQSALHATGYAFDIRRRYESGAQAAAFQYTLERLGALGLIAWSRGRTGIHVVAASQARTLRAAVPDARG